MWGGNQGFGFETASNSFLNCNGLRFAPATVALTSSMLMPSKSLNEVTPHACSLLLNCASISTLFERLMLDS